MNACINNLCQTDAAVQPWAMENNAGLDTMVRAADITPYLGRGTGSILSVFCPADVTRNFAKSYTIVDTSAKPFCRIAPATHIVNSSGLWSRRSFGGAGC